MNDVTPTDVRAQISGPGPQGPRSAEASSVSQADGAPGQDSPLTTAAAAVVNAWGGLALSPIGYSVPFEEAAAAALALARQVASR